nr:GTP cyclohydrolase I [Cryobacterium lyxosi]
MEFFSTSTSSPAQGLVAGLSKLAPLVDVFARRTRSRSGVRVVDALFSSLRPLQAIVVVDCERPCMWMRGVCKPWATIITSAFRGELRLPTEG